jgi:signal transduction histidine kinase
LNAGAREVKEQYAAGLQAYFETEGETALERAYEVGRQAVARGLGVLDMTALHAEALMAALAGARTAEESRRMVERSAHFLSESLAPFEMIHRGFRDANAELRHLAETLEQRVEERTAEAEQAREAAEALAQRMAFLAGASRILASSLDYHETLQRVARLAVPGVADYCLIDVVEDDGIRRLATAHRDPAREELLASLKRYPPDPKWESGVAEVLRTGRSNLVAEVSDSQLQAVAHDAEHLRILRALAPRSSMVLPLVARGRTLGAITFATAEAGRRYGPEDVAFAEELTGRAALAIDNARLYQETQLAIAARDEVLGIVAHDLRNPLNTISMSAGLLLEGVPEEEQRVKQLQLVQRSVDRMDHLIQDLLDTARIEAGRLFIERKREEVAPLVAEIREAFQPAAEEKSLRLETEVPQGVPAVYGDHQRILQVLSNIVGNAIKFTPEGGLITIRAESTGIDVRFSVSDTGPGIPEGDVEHIFDRFWQAQRAKKAGAGLGLAISKGIVEAHGGKIWAESTVGVGSTFYFTIPIAEGERGSRAAA